MYAYSEMYDIQKKCFINSKGAITETIAVQSD